MYKIKCNLPGNREPWKISLETRIQTVISAANQGRRVAIMVYREADTSTFRYRCYNVFQITQTGDWQSVYFFLNELEWVEKLLDTCNLLILSRIKWSYPLNALIKSARKRSMPVLFDVDDLICHISYLPLLTNTLNVHFGSEGDYDFWFSDIARHQAVASQVDGFITTNPFLGQKLSEIFNKPYQVIMNSLNVEQLDVSKTCRERKKYASSLMPFTIGYFSGTPSHINDFRMVHQELIQLLEDYPEIELKIVGYMDFPKEMQDLIQKKRVRFSPLVDFMELQRLIAQVDVNIVPLVQNTFTNCKSELKFFEAAAVDTVTVATPTYTYANSIHHRETGFLCSQGEWYDTIAELYNDAELRNNIAKRAESYCLEKYAGEAFRKQVREAYNFFIAK